MALATLQTARLDLRPVVLADRSFVVDLLNDPFWLQYIGDRGVRSEAAAEAYIRNNLWAQYDAFGYGMYVMQSKATHLPVGMCGLVRRDFLPGPDLGFALLTPYVGHGYAGEAALAVMLQAKSTFGPARLYAIVTPGNQRSMKLLTLLGFYREGICSLPDGEEIDLYATA